MLGPLTWIALVFLCIVMLKIKDLLYRGFFLNTENSLSNAHGLTRIFSFYYRLHFRMGCINNIRRKELKGAAVKLNRDQ